MLKYFRLFWEFFRACMVEELEYRANFLGNLLSSLFGIALAVLTVSIFFWQTALIGGWSYYEVLVLLGVFNTIYGFIEFALRQNMGRLVEHIRIGTLDFILTKPVDSQFFISFRHLVFWRLTDIAMGVGLILFSLWKLERFPDFGDLLMFLLLIIVSLILVYSMWMILMTTSFWFVKIENLSFIFSSFFETTRFPVEAYRGWLRIVLTYLLPAAFITTTPAAALIGRWEWSTVLSSLLVSLLFFAAARRFWRFALKHYTSASS